MIRAVGDDYEPRSFSTWGPKVVAAIGRLPDTIEDRAIVVQMRRRLPSTEPVESLRPGRFGQKFEHIRSKARRWALDHEEELRGADLKPVEELNDRAQDNWHPLLAIADLCGGEWPSRTRETATKLSAQADEDQAGVVLLRDLKAIFEDQQADAIPTEDILKALCDL